MKDLVEKVLGFLMMIAVFLGGITACGWYIQQQPERVHGALALMAAIVLAAFGWNWVKDRVSRQV